MKKLAAICCILILSLTQFPPDAAPYSLYPETTNQEISTPQYLDRANYIQLLSQSPSGELQFFLSNNTVSGPFQFHLKIKTADAPLDIHYLSLYAMQTVKDGTSSKDIPITLFNNNDANYFDYYYSVAIANLETSFVPDSSNDPSNVNSYLTFKSKLTFYFVATEVSDPVLYLKVECPIMMKRPVSVTDTYSDVTSVMLENTFNQISINVEVNSKLEACKQEASYPVLDYTTCTSLAAGTKLSVALNSLAKFQLSLIDETFKKNYYLTKFKITMQSGQMKNPVEFTSLATQPNTYLGKMIFSMIMSIVGDQICVTATAILSMTTGRRMLQTEGTKAAIGMLTTSVSKIAPGSNPPGSTPIPMISSWFLGIVL